MADFDNKGRETLSGIDCEYEAFDGPGCWEAFSKEIMLWKKNGPQYGCQTFALDSLTFAADEVVEKVANGTAMSLPKWGEAIGELKKQLGYLTTLQCHVVVTAHIQIEKDDLMGGLVYLPLIFGKALPGQLPGWFNDVWVTTIQTASNQGKVSSAYRVQTGPDLRIKFAKNTSGGKLELYENPTFENLTRKG